VRPKSAGARPTSPSFKTGLKRDYDDIFVLKPSDSKPQFVRSPSSLRTGLKPDYKDIYVLKPDPVRPKSAGARPTSPSFKTGLKRDYDDIFVLGGCTDIPRHNRKCSTAPAFITGLSCRHTDIFVLNSSSPGRNILNNQPRGVYFRRTKSCNNLLSPSVVPSKMTRSPCSMRVGGLMQHEDLFVLDPTIRPPKPACHTSSASPFRVGSGNKHSDIYTLCPTQSPVGLARSPSSLKAGGSIQHKDIFVLKTTCSGSGKTPCKYASCSFCMSMYNVTPSTKHGKIRPLKNQSSSHRKMKKSAYSENNGAARLPYSLHPVQVARSRRKSNIKRGVWK